MSIEREVAERSPTRAIIEILRNISAATEGQMDEALAIALTSVGGLTTVDRCFLIRLADAGSTPDYEFQWCADGVSRIPPGDLIPGIDTGSWMRERLLAGGVLHVEDVAALPVEAGPEKARWLRHGVRSVLQVPIFDDGRIAGLLAFHSVNSVGDWRDDDMQLLEILGQLLVGAWQRSRAQRDLARTNRLLADIIDFLPDATFVIDREGRVMAWNRAIADMTGVSRRAIIGRDRGAYADIFPTRVLPTLIAQVGQAALASASGGPDQDGGEAWVLRAECFVPDLRDGEGAHLWQLATTLRDAKGRIVGAVASLRDITERKRTELALRRSEEHVRQVNLQLEQRVRQATLDLRRANVELRRKEASYRRIIESLGDRHVFFSHDLKGRLSYVSPSYRQLLGTTDLAELGAKVRVWFGDPANRRGRLYALRTLRGLRMPAWDLFVDAEGQQRVLEVQSVPVLDDDGNVISVEGVARDVTEERRNSHLVLEAKERLLEAEKMAALGGLLAGLTHEIATPVGVGVTAATHVRQICRDGLDRFEGGRLTRSGLASVFETVLEADEAILSNLNRTADLLRNFKQVAADQSCAETRTFDLNEYLGEISRSMMPRFRNTGFALEIECPPGIELNCDPGAVFRIVSNLVMNSLDHGFAELLTGRITISVTTGPRGIAIVYRDDGVGMTPTQKARVFEPFYTTRRSRGGMGLGMHIVYNNVTQILGGRIRCDSAPGRGTCFTITVPNAREVPDATASGYVSVN